MSQVVVEVGPCSVRGVNSPRPEAVSIALACIDDDVALLDERLVAVTELWTDILGEAVGAEADAVMLVCPTWWPAAWVERVRAAAGSAADVQRRATVFGDSATTLVEIATELVVVHRQDGHSVPIANLDVPAAVADQVRAAVGAAQAVLIDVPPGSDELLAECLADRLRSNRIAVSWAGEVRRLVDFDAPVTEQAGPRPVRYRRTSALLAGVMTVACGGFALRGGGPPTGTTTWLTEDRIAVLVPAGWPVQRVTSGPGSARLQLVSPSDDGVALHLTQSAGTGDADLAQTAAVLQAAMTDESDDVFVDFNPTDQRAGRPAVTYREIRADRHVAWTVLVDGSSRIAVGCQSVPGRDELVRDVCDQAIRSAHAVS